MIYVRNIISVGVGTGQRPSQRDREVHSILGSLITSIWHWILRLRVEFKGLSIELYMNNVLRFTSNTNIVSRLR